MSGREQRDVAGEVELDDLRRRRREEIAEHAGARPRIVDPIRHPQVELVDAHLEQVAGLGALHIDRAGQHMGAQALHPGDLGVDVLGVLQHLVRRDASGAEERRGVVLGHQALVRHRVDLHRLPRLDGERGRKVGREVAPDDGLGGRAQRRIGGLRERRRGEARDPQATGQRNAKSISSGVLLAIERQCILEHVRMWRTHPPSSPGLTRRPRLSAHSAFSTRGGTQCLLIGVAGTSPAMTRWVREPILARGAHPGGPARVPRRRAQRRATRRGFR